MANGNKGADKHFPSFKSQHAPRQIAITKIFFPAHWRNQNVKSRSTDFLAHVREERSDPGALAYVPVAV